MRRIERLEMHVAHACNLTCESCSHFANSGHRGVVGLDDAADWMRLWNQRIQPDAFVLLGGEPTLHPLLTDFVLLARECWPAAALELTTNGFFLHRHPKLAEALHRTRTRLCWTIHDKSDAYAAKTGEIAAWIAQRQAEFPFALYTEESWRRWTRRYRGFGSGVLPYTDNHPRSSWEHCACRTCRQLFRGKLWKCSTITYLQLHKAKFPGLASDWDPYLAYQPLDAACSDQELEEFLQREDESICGMCPMAPERFEKASPLIPLGELLAAG